MLSRRAVHLFRSGGSVRFVLRKANNQQRLRCLSSLIVANNNIHQKPLLLSSSSSSLLSPSTLHNNKNQQKRTMFIQTQDTPNPESLKFLPGRGVLDGNSPGQEEEGGEGTGTGFYVTKNETDEISRSPLAKMLFRIDGIKSIYLGSDYITVTKRAEFHWIHIKGQVFSAIMDFYSSGKPVLTETAEVTDTTIFDDDDEIVAMIKELLESRIRPAVQEDGGDIRYVGWEEETGLVTVQLAGSCVGCPSSSVTLKNGVENMLMHYIPEVTGVTALEDNDEDDKNGSSGQPPKTVEKSYEERLAAAGIPFSD